jgi:hypothetical protein
MLATGDDQGVIKVEKKIILQAVFVLKDQNRFGTVVKMKLS